MASDRGEYREINFYPVCSICGHYTKTPDMHEVFVTRAHVSGMKYPEVGFIFTPENVVLLHNHCHVLAQHKYSLKINCAMQILKYHTIEEIEAFFDALPDEATIEGRLLLRRTLSVGFINGWVNIFDRRVLKDG